LKILSQVVATNAVIIKQMGFVLKFDEKTRGAYLFQAIWIDTLLNQIIACHFCSTDYKKQGMLTGLILNELTFSSKIRYFLRILESYPEIASKHPNIKKKLENVREFRNKVAHSKLDTSGEFLSKKTNYIRLIYFKNGKRAHYNITEQLNKEKTSEIVKLHYALNEILVDLTGGELGKLIPIGRLDLE